MTAAVRSFMRTGRAVPEARAFVGRTLAAWQVSERVDDVLLCVSELVTNALRHGTKDGETFVVSLAATDGRLRVEVFDLDRRRPHVRHASAQDTTGRGLLLVEAIADAWGVAPRLPGGKVVWSEFKVATVHDSAAGDHSC